MNSQIRTTLTRLLADVDDNMEFLGTAFNPKDHAQNKVTKSLDQAEKALVNYFLELIGEDYLPHCLSYPDKLGTYCNKCIACKTKDNSEFNDGYEYKTDELRAKLKGGEE